MDSTVIIIHIILLVLLIVLSGFFSGSETALMALNKLKLKHQAKEGKKGALVLEKILQRPENLLGTILLGNNLVNVAASALATSLAINLWGEELGILYATIIMTLALLIFAEVTPKTFSAYHSEGTSYFIARPMKFVMLVLKPFVRVVNIFTNAILKSIGVKKKAGEVFTEEELKTMILIGEESGIIGTKRKEMLHGILELRDMSVKEVMVPRMEIFAINIEESSSHIKEKILSSPYSRIPVFRGDIEKVEGIVLVKDYLKVVASGHEPQLENIMSPPYFIPETKKIQEQLTDFQRKSVHLALIIDEFGGIEGLVSMEDLLEEIVGEIWDETDMKISNIVRHRDGSITVDGKFSIRDLNKSLQVDIPEEDFNTVAGLLLHSMGRIPSKGDSVEFMNLEFIANSV
ncbi:MAG: CNNM domain-containing protein, partial [Deltaproteobacteria bacterium]|nr:CNNM domain-containing protein [Deltaproteobacteria bacterium]